MSRPGRKRKPGSREANGQLKRPTVDMLNELNRAKADQETALVRAQPHRGGSDKPECSTALGRLWLSLGYTDRTLLQAGEDYAGLVRRWRAAWGAKDGTSPSEGAGTGIGPSDATVRAWRAKLDGIEAKLIRASHAVYLATNRLVVDDREVNRPMDVVLGLKIIAVEMGMIKPDHPFR